MQILKLLIKASNMKKGHMLTRGKRLYIMSWEKNLKTEKSFYSTCIMHLLHPRHLGKC